MKCPNCGEEMPKNSCKCLRCGYVCKALVIDSFTKEENGKKEEKIETKHIDPKNVRMGRSGGGGTLDDLFGGLFGGIFGDLFGGDIFGFPQEDGEEGYEGEEPKFFDDFGNPMPFDVFGRDFVEIKNQEYEYLDDSKEEKKESEKTEEDKKKEKGFAANAKNIYNKFKDKMKRGKNDKDENGKG